MVKSLARIALACAVLLLPASAHGAFPGANGRIAFSDSIADGSGVEPNHVYTMNPDGSGENQLTFSAYPAQDWTPVYSPDGTKIAFATNRGGQVQIGIMNADGTNQHVVPNDGNLGEMGSWSPDGTKLVFSTIVGGNADIYAINVDGSGQTRLTSDPAADGAPAWSPDGGKIAFTRTSGGATETHTMNADGSGDTTLTNGGGFFPAWSPDGRKIAFVDHHYFGTVQNLFVMNRDGTNPVQIGPGDGYVYAYPAWSPDGTKLAVTRAVQFEDNYSIWTMNRDGTGAQHVRFTFDPVKPDWQPIPYTGFPRPRGASPFQTYLVPAYKPCTAPNHTHGAPLAFGSCSPPQPASDYLTLGTPDANGAPANGRGSVFLAARTGDMKVVFSMRDVRNQADLSDHTGRLEERAIWRITDQNVGTGGPGPVTMTDVPFPVFVPCAATAEPAVGSTCALTTTINAQVPGALVANKRTVIELGQVQVYDGGADGDPATGPPGTLFLTQGLFVP